MFNWFKKSKPPETYSNVSLNDIRSSVSAGVTVNEKTALNLVSVYACVRAIAETLASLPFPVYQRLEAGGKNRMRGHPVYGALNISPDGILPAMQWREAGIGHLLTWGNWYNEIESTVGGDLLGLHLLPPNKVQPQRTKSNKVEYKVEGSYVPIPADRMLHVAGLGFDGLVGYSPIRMGKEAIGLGMATERFGSSWFGNGSRGQGIIVHPQKLSDSAKENMRDSLSAVHGGPDNAHRWMIFEEGVSVQSLGTPPEDAQFLGTRLFQLQEICRLYRISPVVVQELSRSTFSNNEQEMISFVVHTLRPWCRRIENEINRKLFPFDQEQEFFCEHLLDGLLRGDSTTRNAAYATGRQWGWYSADDVNEMENRNPLPDGQGKVYLSPANMVPATDYIKKPEEPKPTQSTESTSAPNENVQATALNGAQIDSLLTIVQSVADGKLPAGTAGAVISASFPTLGSNQIASILNPLESFEPQEPTEPVQSSLKSSVDRLLHIEVDAIKNAAKEPKQFLHSIDAFYERHKTLVRGEGFEPELFDSRDELLELSGTVAADDLSSEVESWATERLSKSQEIVRNLAI